MPWRASYFCHAASRKTAHHSVSAPLHLCNAQALYVTPQSGTGQTASPPPNAAIYPSINAALSALASARKAGMTEAASILVSAGTYRERIVLGPGIGPLTISAWPQVGACPVQDTSLLKKLRIALTDTQSTLHHVGIGHAVASCCTDFRIQPNQHTVLMLKHGGWLGCTSMLFTTLEPAPV